MSKGQEVNAKAVSTTGQLDPLQTKYFCKISSQQVCEVVMQISAMEISQIRRLPLRYVLVIDVSGSMDGTVGNEVATLLDRVKIFAELVIQNIDKDDSLAIVTFSNDAEIDFPMTKMTMKAKDEATKVVDCLVTRGGTNIDIGLMTGLDVITKSSDSNSRDSIIIFTDGAANDGETDPDKLVEKYLGFQESMGKTSCVPVSAFTIGSYPPVFLLQIADHLGSEAFYWLNEHEDFEANMLIPVFLREFTHVTDVQIVLTTLQGVKFDTEDIRKKHLKGSSETELKYFIHSIPADIKKHMPVTLMLPQENIQDLDGQHIMDIKVTFLDHEMAKQVINDFVVLCTTSLRQSKDGKKSTNPSILDEISAFTIIRNEVNVSWACAQTSLTVVAEETYRKISLIGMNNAQYHIMSDDLRSARKEIQEAILEIGKITRINEKILGDRNQYTTQIKSCADQWTAKLNFGKKFISMEHIGRVFAMESSIASEMPTAKGVFDPKKKQPYMPPRVEKKLKEYEKIVGTKKNKRKDFETTRVFKAQNILVSESLRDKKVVTIRQETMSELIIRCGGRPVPNVNTVLNNTLLVCAAKDYRNETVIVRDAKRAKIPIVREQFIYDCIRQKKILDLDKYLVKPPVVADGST